MQVDGHPHTVINILLSYCCSGRWNLYFEWIFFESSLLASIFYGLKSVFSYSLPSTRTCRVWFKVNFQIQELWSLFSSICSLSLRKCDRIYDLIIVCQWLVGCWFSRDISYLLSLIRLGAFTFITGCEVAVKGNLCQVWLNVQRQNCPKPKRIKHWFFSCNSFFSFLREKVFLSAIGYVMVQLLQFLVQFSSVAANNITANCGIQQLCKTISAIKEGTISSIYLNKPWQWHMHTVSWLNVCSVFGGILES